MTARRPSKPAGEYTVFYDSHCRVCTASTRWIKRLDSHDQFTCASLDDQPSDLDSLSCQNELKLRCPDGTVLSGWTAVATIARRLPLTSWFGLIASLRPFHYLGSHLYRWVVRHRYRFGRSRHNTGSTHDES